MPSDIINYSKIPIYNFVLELEAPMGDLRRFADEILSDDRIDFSKLNPEVRHLTTGDRRRWRLTYWGAPSLPLVKKVQWHNGRLVVCASTEITFPEMALNRLIKHYNLIFRRGFCLADDESEALMLSSDKDMPIKTHYLTRLQMRQAGLLKIL